jgi:hypothetical protein
MYSIGIEKMPRYTSANRQVAYESLLSLRRGKLITAQQYQQKKGVIDRREAKSVALYNAKQDAIEARARAKRQETANRNEINAADRTDLGEAKPDAVSRTGPTRESSVPRIPSE